MILYSFPGPVGPLPQSVREGQDQLRLGGVGLAIGSAVAAWVEFGMLTERLRRKVAPSTVVSRSLLRLAPAALPSGLTLFVLRRLFDHLPSLPAALLVLVPGGVVYMAVARETGIVEVEIILRPIRRVVRRYAPRS